MRAGDDRHCIAQVEDLSEMDVALEEPGACVSDREHFRARRLGRTGTQPREEGAGDVGLAREMRRLDAVRLQESIETRTRASHDACSYLTLSRFT